MLAALSPDDITDEFVVDHDVKEAPTLGQIIVVIINCLAFAPENSDVFPLQDLPDNLELPLFIERGPFGFSAAERTLYQAIFMLVLDGPDAVAAELVFARKESRLQDEFVADEAKKLLLVLLLHYTLVTKRFIITQLANKQLYNRRSLRGLSWIGRTV